MYRVPDHYERRFWVQTRLPEVYPRDIEHAVAIVLPVAIVKLPTLTTREVELWLSQNRMIIEVQAQRVAAHVNAHTNLIAPSETANGDRRV